MLKRENEQNESEREWKREKVNTNEKKKQKKQKKKRTHKTTSWKNMLLEECERKMVTKFKWLKERERTEEKAMGGRKVAGAQNKKTSNENGNRETQCKIYIFRYMFCRLKHVHISPITSNFWCFALTSKNIGNWKQISNAYCTLQLNQWHTEKYGYGRDRVLCGSSGVRWEKLWIVRREQEHSEHWTVQ